MQFYYSYISFSSISLDLLCNGNLDCKDKSDEASCENIDISKSYRVDIPTTTGNGILYLIKSFKNSLNETVLLISRKVELECKYYH